MKGGRPPTQPASACALPKPLCSAMLHACMQCAARDAVCQAYASLAKVLSSPGTPTTGTRAQTHTYVWTHACPRIHAHACTPGSHVAPPQAGEQTVWERMPAIECNCTLEAMLDKCVAKVQQQVGASALSTLRLLLVLQCPPAHIAHAHARLPWFSCRR